MQLKGSETSDPVVLAGKLLEFFEKTGSLLWVITDPQIADRATGCRGAA
jgi:hypothetical protein